METKHNIFAEHLLDRFQPSPFWRSVACRRPSGSPKTTRTRSILRHVRTAALSISSPSFLNHHPVRAHGSHEGASCGLRPPRSSGRGARQRTAHAGRLRDEVRTERTREWRVPLPPNERQVCPDEEDGSREVTCFIKGSDRHRSLLRFCRPGRTKAPATAGVFVLY